MIQHYRKILDDYKSRKNLLLEQKNNKINRKNKLQKEVDNLSKARYCLSDILKITQQNLSNYIEPLVTMVIQSVFKPNFYFLVNNEIKRNKSEISFRVYKGNEVDRCVMLNNSFIPRQEQGGGLLDVISFVLRPVIWSLEEPRSPDLMILDEPFHFFGSEMQRKCSQMLKEISLELGIQFIIITHSPFLAYYADKSFFVSHDETKSLVSEINTELIRELSIYSDWEERLENIVFPHKNRTRLLKKKLDN